MKHFHNLYGDVDNTDLFPESSQNSESYHLNQEPVASDG